MVHRSKEIPKIRIHHPLVPLLNLAPDLAQCIFCRSSFSVSEAGFIKHRFKDRFQPVQQRLLTHPIIDCWYAKRTKLPWLARLGNQFLPHRLRSVSIRPEFFM